MTDCKFLITEIGLLPISDIRKHLEKCAWCKNRITDKYITYQNGNLTERFALPANLNFDEFMAAWAMEEAVWTANLSILIDKQKSRKVASAINRAILEINSCLFLINKRRDAASRISVFLRNDLAQLEDMIGSGPFVVLMGKPKEEIIEILLELAAR